MKKFSSIILPIVVSIFACTGYLLGSEPESFTDSDSEEDCKSTFSLQGIQVITRGIEEMNTIEHDLLQLTQYGQKIIDTTKLVSETISRHRESLLGMLDEGHESLTPVLFIQDILDEQKKRLTKEALLGMLDEIRSDSLTPVLFIQDILDEQKKRLIAKATEQLEETERKGKDTLTAFADLLESAGSTPSSVAVAYMHFTEDEEVNEALRGAAQSVLRITQQAIDGARDRIEENDYSILPKFESLEVVSSLATAFEGGDINDRLRVATDMERSVTDATLTARVLRKSLRRVDAFTDELEERFKAVEVAHTSFRDALAESSIIFSYPRQSEDRERVVLEAAKAYEDAYEPFEQRAVSVQNGSMIVISQEDNEHTDRYQSVRDEQHKLKYEHDSAIVRMKALVSLREKMVKGSYRTVDDLRTALIDSTVKVQSFDKDAGDHGKVTRIKKSLFIADRL